MKKYLFKLSMVALGLLVALCLEFVVYLLFAQFGDAQYTKAYTAAVVDKVARLESMEESKIILVGNSNVAIGFDSAAIEEAFDMPVVNLGLHGALCNSFHEGLAMLNINEGDIVVVAHSDYNDDTSVMDADILWLTLENNTELLPVLRLDYAWKLIKGFPAYLQNNFWLSITGTGNAEWDGIYARDVFNEYGDNVYPRPESEYTFSAADTFEISVSDVTTDRLNELNEYCIAQGATLVVAGFPVADGDYTASTESYTDAWAQLEAALDCAVISDITDYFIPYEYFYDTRLHLTEDGVNIRTEQFIADLTAYLGE